MGDSYKAMYEGYKKFAAGNVKNSKVDGEELAERMVGLEKEIEDLTEKYNQMLIKYSFAYGRKDKYKEQYLNLKKTYDEEKAVSSELKKTLEEHAQEWKNKAEYEESKKLEQTIANQLTLKRAEAIEARATELLEEFNKLKILQEAEINCMTKNHTEAITKETKIKEDVDKNLKIKEAEIKKQRLFYGDKMKEIRAQLDELERNKADLIRDLAASDNKRRELDTKVKALEKDKKDNEPSDELKNELKYWREEAGKLRNKIKDLENIIIDYEKHSMIFWKTDPKSIFKSNYEYTKEDRERFINDLKELIQELSIEAEYLPHGMDMDESMFSTLTESRVQEDLSTTGGLGDNEGMDTTMGHADPEDMDTSSEPKTQRKKRRMEIRQTDTEKEETREGKKEAEKNPGKGKGREEVKPLEVTTENPSTSMAEEIERLKEQHRLQMEEHQLNSERTLER